MEYFRYTLQFLNTITFTSSTYTDLDNFLNGVVKGYLNHNFGFLPIAPTEDELDELADEIGASYDLMLNDIKPRYEEVLRLGTVHTFRSKDITDSVYGDEERTGKYYEPVVSSAQASVKTNGELTTWEDDKVTLSREEDRVLSESAIKDFFKEIKEEVELYFIDFVNIYADGTGCQKPYTLEQLQAINSGATKTKIEQIQTNKENIDLLVDAVAGITDALDDKQDKLNATQLDAVNSGINTTKVAQIETNKNNIAQLSNPNLLINGDFRVNQRGEPNYVGVNSVKYTVDRWAINWSPTISFNSSTKTLSFTGNGSFVQYIEDTNSLLSKTVTLSAKVDGVVYSGTATLNSSYSADAYPITISTPHCDLLLRYVNSKTSFRVDFSESHFSSNYSIVVDYIKLEIGSVATPFSPRPYAEELQICQRYYYKSAPNSILKTARSGYNFYDNCFLFKQTMRTAPTRTLYSIDGTVGNLTKLSDSSNVSANTSYATVDSCSIQSNGGTLTANEMYVGYIELDAEIY